MTRTDMNKAKKRYKPRTKRKDARNSPIVCSPHQKPKPAPKKAEPIDPKLQQNWWYAKHEEYLKCPECGGTIILDSKHSGYNTYCCKSCRSFFSLHYGEYKLERRYLNEARNR